MSEQERVFVSIYCKIFADTFSGDMEKKFATDEEIFEFLMRDAQQCYDDDDNLIPGDCNLWYLGCNEKFGFLKYQDKSWRWSFGESSFRIVEEFICTIYKDGHFTEQQFQTLMDKIQEGRLIDNMYDIKDYLICKREGRSWNKSEEASNFRGEMKLFVAAVEGDFQRNGFRVYHQ